MDKKKVRRLTYTYLDAITPQTLDFFGNKRNIVIFLNEIVKQGGDMLAADALGYEWLDISELLKADAVLRNLVEEQDALIVRKAEQLLCNRSMHGFEEAVEERGEIVKKNRKFNDKILMDYVKAHNPKYWRDASEDEMPAFEIKRFELPVK